MPFWLNLMNWIQRNGRMSARIVAAGLFSLSGSHAALGVTTAFFDSSQTTNWVASETTSDTLRSEGYLFTITRDKLFTGGVGLTNPIGRAIRIPWPTGLEAQAVTTGPVLSGAKITIQREDGQTFAIESFTNKLLANTAGAGGAFEIMPLLHGEDGLPDPLAYDASGMYGNSFTYHTPELAGFDAYIMTLYVDYALMSLTVVDASLPPPALEIVQGGATSVQLAWPMSAAGYALESAVDLVIPVWTPVTNGVALEGEHFTVTLEALEAQRMYRLRK